MDDVREIYGIGSKKANELKKYYNIRSVRTLNKFVRKIPDIISDSQRTGLKYHDRTAHTISYAEAERHKKFITKIIPAAIVAGSYRRKEKKIGDLDVIVTSSIKYAVDKLTKAKYIVATLAMGEEKFSGIARLPNTTSYRRLDIIKTNELEKPFALLYFTGDFVQNIIMRQKAKRMKHKLTQHGIKNMRTGKMITGIKSEKDIFAFLRIPFKEPEDRTHKGNEKEVFNKLKTK
jgi:DNA polymerase/3'-5' exonuclease PolX